MMISGYPHFSDMSHLINTEQVHWIKYLYSNIDAVIRILVVLSENNHCKICNDFSLNYTTKASLGNHYKQHKKETVHYFLSNYSPMTPEELHEIINIAQHREMTH